MSRPISTVPVPLNPWIPLIQVLPAFVSWLSLLSRLSKENASLFFTLRAPSTNSRSPYFLSCSRPNLKLNSQQCGLYKRYCFLWVVIFFSTMSGFLLIFFPSAWGRIWSWWCLYVDSPSLNWKLWVHSGDDLRLTLLCLLPATFFPFIPPCETLLCSISDSLTFHYLGGLSVTCKLNIQFSWPWMKMLNPDLAPVPEDSYC